MPKVLTAAVAEPDPTHVVTNGDLLELLLEYQLSMRLCNGKLNAIEKAYGRDN